ENGIKTIEDLAGCATDELAGWTERNGSETTRHKGILDEFEVSRQQAEDMIMSARVKAGWIEPQDEDEDEVEADAPAQEGRRWAGAGRSLEEWDVPRRRDEGPHRRCIVTRAERDPDEMIRFVA